MIKKKEKKVAVNKIYYLSKSLIIIEKIIINAKMIQNLFISFKFNNYSLL